MQHSTKHIRTPDDKVREALRDIIEGKNVKRIIHELLYEGTNVTPIFIEELERARYEKKTVGSVKAEPGERIPAFYIEGTVAYFGWVFWEQFTSWKMRKLWGSVVKNARGDWDRQIPPSRNTIIYANESMKLEMDIDHPAEF